MHDTMRIENYLHSGWSDSRRQNSRRNSGKKITYRLHSSLRLGNINDEGAVTDRRISTETHEC